MQRHTWILPNSASMGAALLCALTLLSTQVQGLEYRLSIDSDLTRIRVKLCAPLQRQLESLIAAQHAGDQFFAVSALNLDGTETPMRRSGSLFEFQGEAARCVRYVVQVPEPDGSERWSIDTARTIGFDKLLLRPATLPRWDNTRLIVETRENIEVAAPGMRRETGGSVTFELLDRPTEWDGSVAFGRLSTEIVSLGTRRLNISIIGAGSNQQIEKLRTWVKTGARAIASVHGQFPVSEVQVLVFALGYHDDPVPWGEVKRGGADAVHLYVDATRSLETLNQNWVLSHELSHLLHPYVARGASWLPEGIASYYQNVSRARSGLIPPKTAWQKLHAGFERGRKQMQPGSTLARDTRRMMREARYMRVYWSGAAIALIGDVQLRGLSGGKQSLDSVLAAVASCCLPSHRRWPADELMRKFDAVSGYEVFVPLYEMYVMNPQFPDLSSTYRRLGLTTRQGKLTLSDAPRSIESRDAIMVRSRRSGS